MEVPCNINFNDKSIVTVSRNEKFQKNFQLEYYKKRITSDILKQKVWWQAKLQAFYLAWSIDEYVIFYIKFFISNFLLFLLFYFLLFLSLYFLFNLIQYYFIYLFIFLFYCSVSY